MQKCMILHVFNDWKKTTDVNTGKGSILDLILDLTFVSSSLAPLCEWEVRDKSFGSDHYFVISTLRQVWNKGNFLEMSGKSGYLKKHFGMNVEIFVKGHFRRLQTKGVLG